MIDWGLRLPFFLAGLDPPGPTRLEQGRPRSQQAAGTRGRKAATKYI
jgi:hypothetical protein